MLRPGMLLTPSLTGTFVDTLLRTDFSTTQVSWLHGGLALPVAGLSPARRCVLGWARHIKKYLAGAKSFRTPVAA